MSAVTIRRAVAADQAVPARLLSDMQAHYKSPDPPGGANEMARLLTREGDRLPFALLAEHQGATVGFATLSPVLCGGAYQWELFLKDRSTSSEKARGLGVGRAFLAAMARIAVDEDYCRIDWTTDATNHGAQRLYDGLGVPRQDKRFYRLVGENLEEIRRQMSRPDPASLRLLQFRREGAPDAGLQAHGVAERRAAADPAQAQPDAADRRLSPHPCAAGRRRSLVRHTPDRR